MGGGNLQLLCNVYLVCILFFCYGLPDIMNDVRYDKNQICSKSTIFCGFSTFSFAFIVCFTWSVILLWFAFY